MKTFFGLLVIVCTLCAGGAIEAGNWLYAALFAMWAGAAWFATTKLESDDK